MKSIVPISKGVSNKKHISGKRKREKVTMGPGRRDDPHVFEEIV